MMDSVTHIGIGQTEGRPECPTQGHGQSGAEGPGYEPVLLLRVEEAAVRLGIARTSMFKLIGTGEVESVHVGRLRRIPVGALTEYVDRLRHGQKPLGA